MFHNYTKEELIKTGIYKITCISNNKFYIGSASSIKGSTSKLGFYRRLNLHINDLTKNKHKNKILQNAWNKYGEKNFKFEILEYCNPENCKKREQYYLDNLNPFDENGFNICRNSLSNKKIVVKSTNTNNRDLENLNNHLKITILQYDLNNNFIKEWIGISKTAKELNICRTNIYKCCRGKEKSAGGFIWRYKTNNFSTIPQLKFNIKVTDIENNNILIFNTLKEVCNKFNYCQSTIRNYCNSNLLLENKYLLEKIIL